MNNAIKTLVAGMILLLIAVGMGAQFEAFQEIIYNLPIDAPGSVLEQAQTIILSVATSAVALLAWGAKQLG